ncbi:MAG: serine/threonine-protein phosphatase [Myxococcales bacterium]|nr:MAG: serine/threonine-protein phosphatase [Myxococcales bacterium]
METQPGLATASLPPSPKGEVRIDAAGLTHTGRVRKTNEDAYLVATLQRSMLVHDASPAARGWFTGQSAGTMLVVADGMGGQGGGDVASRVAVSAVVNHLLNCMPWATTREVDAPPATHTPSLPGVRDQLNNALVEGDSTVKSTGAESGTPQMGTTLTMALVVWPIAYVAHVGDTRCYLYRGGELRRLTTDHTLAQRLQEVSPGTVDETSRLHHVLWNSLGASQELPQPEIQKLTLQHGDVLLLCSDGVTKHLNDTELSRLLNGAVSAEQRCAMLVERANGAGGTDNMTAVVASFQGA